MKFEPGEEYQVSLPNGYVAPGTVVQYIGVSDSLAVVESRGIYLFKVPFDCLKPVKKKQRLFIALPEHSVCSPPEGAFCAYVSTDLNRLQNCNTEGLRYSLEPYPRIIELETVEPQDPL